MERAHPGARLAVAVFLAAAAALAALPTSSGAGAPPQFSGTIPDLGVTAGEENLSAYDFGAQFTDADGTPLRFELEVTRPMGGTSLFRNPYPSAQDPWIDIRINGTRMELRSVNASAWGHWLQLVIQASDGGAHVESNAFNVSIGPPPVANRTWSHFPLFGGAFTASSGQALREGCSDFFRLGTMAFPSDAFLAQMSFVVGRTPPPPPEGPYNGTPPPSDPYASSVRLTATSAGFELLNATVLEQPERVYLNMTAVNLILEAEPHQFGMASFTIQFTACAEGGVAWLTMAQGEEWLVRLPPGADRNNSNPSAPVFNGAMSDRNVTAGDSAGTTVDLRPFFSEADGDPLVFDLDPMPGGDANVSATISDGILRLSATADASNTSVQLRARARDPFGASASSNAWNATVAAAASSGGPRVPPPDEVTVVPGPSVEVPVVLAVAAVAVVAIALLEVAQYAVLGTLVGIVASRARSPSPLDHFARGQIYQLVKENPGIHLSEVVRRTEMRNGTVAYHLRVLERAGHVRSERDGTKTRFTDTGAKPKRRDYGLSERELRVLDAVAASPGILQEELAERVGMSRSRVSRAVRRLAVLGLVTTSRQGRTASIALRNEEPGGLPASPD